MKLIESIGAKPIIFWCCLLLWHNLARTSKPSFLPAPLKWGNIGHLEFYGHM